MESVCIGCIGQHCWGMGGPWTMGNVVIDWLLYALHTVDGGSYGMGTTWEWTTWWHCAVEGMGRDDTTQFYDVVWKELGLNTTWFYHVLWKELGPNTTWFYHVVWKELHSMTGFYLATLMDLLLNTKVFIMYNGRSRRYSTILLCGTWIRLERLNVVWHDVILWYGGGDVSRRDKHSGEFEFPVLIDVGDGGWTTLVDDSGWCCVCGCIWTM